MNKFLFFKKIEPGKEYDALRKRPAVYWQKRGEKMVLDLFRFTSKNVKAYSALLKENKINRSFVKSYKDFLAKAPLLTKDNYLRKAEYQDLFPHDTFYEAQTFSATSGSSGKPFFFPRGEEHDWQYEYVAEIILRKHFDAEHKRSLVVIGFGLGIWIGGVFTYKIFEKISAKGYDISIVPMGPNKESILKMVQDFGHYYDQIILCGYPPFIKDLLDESDIEGFSWHKHNVKLFTAAEGVPEDFQRYLIKKLGIKDPLKDITNIYGTVELGTMAYETPFSNLIKEILRNDKDLLEKICNSREDVLTLAQYYPHHLHFEEIEGNVFVSGFGSAIPLLRYQFPDKGRVVPFDVMIQKFKAYGIDLIKEAKKRGIYNLVQKIPFVCLYGRNDLAISFVGINIFPEYIKGAFYHSFISKYVTGKFSMEVIYEDDLDQRFIINVELRKGVKKKTIIKNRLFKLIFPLLLKHSTEYNYLYTHGSESYKKRILPKVKIHEYNHKKYFSPGVKQKWVIK